MAEITLDHVATLPPPGLVVPGAYAFSPDGGTLTFLHAKRDGLARVLWSHDVASGETGVLFEPAGEGVTDENVSREEALRRERQRLMHTGVTHYEWADDEPVVLVPVGGRLWLVRDGVAAEVPGVEGAIDPHISADGAEIAFVRGGEVWVARADTGAERRLTDGAEPGLTNGVADYISQEEMGRTRGFWWSPDGAWIAYQQADERHIPAFTIPHWGGGDPHDTEEHRYPFAGAENPRVRLGVVPAAGGETRWLDLGGAEYLARVGWHPDGRLLAQLQNRAQTRVELRAYDPATGRSATLLVEECEPWVNLHNDLRVVKETGEIVWTSERSGARQIFLHAPDGSEPRQISPGPWPVDAVLAVDGAGRRIAFSGSESPVESHVWTGSLDGGDAKRLTPEPGMNGAVFSKDLSSWVHVHHSRRRAPSVTLRSPDRILHEPATVELPLQEPEIFSFAARDGETLYGCVYLPRELPAPLIVSVYGGPGPQMVSDSWGLTAAMQAQYLAQQGFVVVKVDNRGSARRGLAFEAGLNRRMGTIEIDDQVDGVRYAQSRGWVDGDRVGITGWSYGGYMTIMSMLKAPEVFKAGVAGAPVTDWDGYDTHYTERYMGTPQDNPDGYRDASALTHAGALAGRLLIIHGMIDENVHFRNTARFLDAVAKANRSVDLMIYPNERHSPRSLADRRNLQGRIAGYFREHL